MENKINIAELLKDCPKGMELDCTMYENLVFVEVDSEAQDYPITTKLKNGTLRWFTSDGRYELTNDAKCVIFPKGKTTWEGFVPPCKFKDGDVITCTNSACSFVAIFKEMNTDITFKRYVSLTLDDTQQFCTKDNWADFKTPRFATEEEKQKLFDAIKTNGYKWNAETKTLEKLPKFKVGDIISDSLGTCIFKGEGEFEGTVNYYCGISSDDYFCVKDDEHNPSGHYGYIVNYRLSTEKEKEKLFQAIKDNGYRWDAETKTLEKIEPKFKDGDVIFVDNKYKSGNFYYVAIFKEIKNDNRLYVHASYSYNNDIFFSNGSCLCKITNSTIIKFATEEQKEKLFTHIKINGYKWNEKTKTLEELFPYKIGTKIWVKSDKEHKYIHTIVGISRNSFGNLEYEVKEEKTGVVVHYPKNLLIPVTEEKPRFNVGDKIRHKENTEWVCTIKRVEDRYYVYGHPTCYTLPFSEQNDYELVSPKFDITTLVPFETKVLVRDNDYDEWKGSFWGHLRQKADIKYDTIRGTYRQCIPYNDDTKHLLGKIDDCDEYYKTWL